MIAFISLGSNLGDRIDNIKKAIELISSGNKIISISPYYITKPMYYINQPYFINCVIKIDTSLLAHELLVYLNNIENKLGRVRNFKNSPRTIDLDIIYYDSKCINSFNLVIPHPKVYERAFVLRPLCDIEPFFTDPLKKVYVRDILLNLNYNNRDLIRLPSSFNESVSFLSTLLPYDKKDIKTDYIKETLSLLNDPQKKCGRIIHITGSVGKTSTAKYIHQLLLKLGYKASLYISPHIYDVRERIVINNKKITKTSFYKNLLNIISKAKVIHSVFEYLTMIALMEFAKERIDFSVVEVGMGGENDATNVFDKSYAVFTGITLEHQKYLGRTLEKISFNKAGIIKKNSIVFISQDNRKKVIDIVSKKAKETNSSVFLFPRTSIKSNKDPFKYHNFSFAKFIVSKITDRKLSFNYNFSPPPLRFKRIKVNEIDILLDGAHTPLSLKILLKHIDVNKYPVCVASFMKDKKIRECIGLIKEAGFKYIILSSSYSPRSFDPFIYKEDGMIVFNDPVKAIKYLLKLNKNTLFTGSLYFCSDVIKIIKGREKEIVYFKEL